MIDKFKLSIQNFAEEASNGNDTSASGATSTSQSSPSIDYEKIAEIVSKRSSSTEESVLKGYFKQQGLDEKQMSEAINSYKQAQSQKQQEEANRINNLVKETETLKITLLNKNIDEKATSVALSLGVDSTKIPFLLKLMERKDLANEKGEILEDKTKLSIETVLKAFPDFKSASNGMGIGFQAIGANGQGSQTTELDAKIDAAFGITKK